MTTTGIHVWEGDRSESCVPGDFFLGDSQPVIAERNRTGSRGEGREVGGGRGGTVKGWVAPAYEYEYSYEYAKRKGMYRPAMPLYGPGRDWAIRPEMSGG